MPTDCPVSADAFMLAAAFKRPGKLLQDIIKGREISKGIEGRPNVALQLRRRTIAPAAAGWLILVQPFPCTPARYE
jgi:hypothetical protein